MTKSNKELLLHGKISHVEEDKSGFIQYILVDKGKSSCVVYATGDGELKISQTRGSSHLKPKKLLDIKEMPNFNLTVKDGMSSVSEGKIFWTDDNYVTCKEHGACLAVNNDRTIWRCPTCHEGAYVIWDEYKEIRWFDGKYRVKVLIKGKRTGRRGPVTWRILALEEIPNLKSPLQRCGDLKLRRTIWKGEQFTTIPRRLWRHPRK